MSIGTVGIREQCGDKPWRERFFPHLLSGRPTRAGTVWERHLVSVWDPLFVTKGLSFGDVIALKAVMTIDLGKAGDENRAVKSSGEQEPEWW